MSTVIKIEGSEAQQKAVIDFARMRRIPYAIAPVFKCGEVKGDFELKYKGGCMEPVDIEDAFRCADCCVYFHRKCIKEHFESEDFSEPK